MVFPRSFLSLKVLSAFTVNFVVVVTTHKSHDRRIAASLGKREENGFLAVENPKRQMPFSLHPFFFPQSFSLVTVSFFHFFTFILYLHWIKLISFINFIAVKKKKMGSMWLRIAVSKCPFSYTNFSFYNNLKC